MLRQYVIDHSTFYTDAHVIVDVAKLSQKTRQIKLGSAKQDENLSEMSLSHEIHVVIPFGFPFLNKLLSMIPHIFRSLL